VSNYSLITAYLPELIGNSGNNDPISGVALDKIALFGQIWRIDS
jgi:hypothetical protein